MVSIFCIEIVMGNLFTNQLIILSSWLFALASIDTHWQLIRRYIDLNIAVNCLKRVSLSAQMLFLTSQTIYSAARADFIYLSKLQRCTRFSSVWQYLALACAHQFFPYKPVTACALRSLESLRSPSVI